LALLLAIDVTDNQWMRVIATGLFVLLIQAVPVLAQELAPRVYWPAPEGTTILSVGYTYVSGDIAADPTLPVTALDSKIHTGLIGFRHTLDLFGRSSNIVFEVPYTEAETTGKSRTGDLQDVSYHGLGDVQATLSVNLVGAPSLTGEDFAKLRRNPHPILGASLKVLAPTGDYDADKLLNVGTNRWAMRAELGYIQPLKPKWLLEIEAGVWFFADNDNVRGFTREQKPIYAVDVHLVRRFDAGFWVSLDAVGYRGGRSTVGGQELDDIQRDSKAGFTFLYPFLAKHALKLSYSKGSLNDSDEDFDTFLISYQQRL
jgi:hypothetical protein